MVYFLDYNGIVMQDFCWVCGLIRGYKVTCCLFMRYEPQARTREGSTAKDAMVRVCTHRFVGFRFVNTRTWTK
jgi:hypothetical protein